MNVSRLATYLRAINKLSDAGTLEAFDYWGNVGGRDLVLHYKLDLLIVDDY